jgi:hypothetical protein
MIDFVRKDETPERPDLIKLALDHFNKFDSNYMKWTPEQTFTMNVATPPGALQFFQDEADMAMNLAPALANGKSLKSKIEVKGDSAYIVFSGEGAAELAKNLRDRLGKNFPGSANLPEGPKK